MARNDSEASIVISVSLNSTMVNYLDHLSTYLLGRPSRTTAIHYLIYQSRFDNEQFARLYQRSLEGESAEDVELTSRTYYAPPEAHLFVLQLSMRTVGEKNHSLGFQRLSRLVLEEDFVAEAVANMKSGASAEGIKARHLPEFRQSGNRRGMRVDYTGTVEAQEIFGLLGKGKYSVGLRRAIYLVCQADEDLHNDYLSVVYYAQLLEDCYELAEKDEAFRTLFFSKVSSDKDKPTEREVWDWTLDNKLDLRLMHEQYVGE